MTVSGTEATMHAMRIARAYTGRDRIVKFEGQYHGVHDYALISVSPDDMSDLGDPDAPVRLAWGRGIPDAVADTIIPARYNNIDALRRLFEARGEEIAAIIVEPVLGNAQGILPKPGFHQAMRALTEEFGILLIFDEVKTGFRFAKGGAAEYFGVTPDLATYAKAMGNGYPAAAFGGREEVMSVLPDKVSHGGTYAGNRVAAAAAVKTLTILRDTDALEVVHATGRRVQDGLREVLNPTGLAVPLHRPSAHVRDHVLRGRGDRVPRLGDDGPRAVRRDRGRDARRAERCPSPIPASRGSSARRTRRATSWTGSSRSSRTRSTPRSRRERTGRQAAIGPSGSAPRLGSPERSRAAWSSTATRSARSTGQPPSCSRSARARARPG